MRHFEPALAHLVPPPAPVVKMRTLLEARKETIEAMIRERHRAARASGTTANVSTFSAALRALKRQLAGLDKTPHKEAVPHGKS